jgi:hypothetical protein
MGDIRHAYLEGPTRMDESPFGIPNPPLGPPFVVLDKSFLDAVSSPQLQYHVQQGITFGVTDVLMYELMRKSNDDQRKRSLFKLSDVQGLVLLPGVGQMFRAEGKYRKPALSILRARRLKITPGSESSEEPFSMTASEMCATEERTAELQKRVPEIIEIWLDDLGSMPTLKGVPQSELPEKLAVLEREILEDPESMRQFYENHRLPPFPPANLIDERWAYFRWIQVYLLAGLDFFHRHGGHSDPNREKVMNELLDLDYTITALLVGGLASCEKRIVQRFKFLRPGGTTLRGPF